MWFVKTRTMAEAVKTRTMAEKKPKMWFVRQEPWRKIMKEHHIDPA